MAAYHCRAILLLAAARAAAPAAAQAAAPAALRVDIASGMAPRSVEIAPGVLYPVVQYGTCTDCSTKGAPPCCGTDLASLGGWLEAQSAAGGVAAVDTQLRYNQTAAVGRALARNGGMPRDRLWITSKVDPKVFCQAADPKATVLAMLRQSLHQLTVSFLDLALLHEPCDRSGKPTPADKQAWAALSEAVKLGLTRAIGVDKFSIAQIEVLTPIPAVLMGPMSMSHHDEDILAYCRRRGITFNAYGIMHGCKFTEPHVLALGAKYNASASQICMVWTRQRGCTMAVGVGTDSSSWEQYTREDLDVFGFNLTVAEMQTLNGLSTQQQRGETTRGEGLYGMYDQ
jgi:diketogulonate reductase-like aldo/keto reductase